MVRGIWRVVTWRNKWLVKGEQRKREKKEEREETERKKKEDTITTPLTSPLTLLPSLYHPPIRSHHLSSIHQSHAAGVKENGRGLLLNGPMRDAYRGSGRGVGAGLTWTKTRIQVSFISSLSGCPLFVCVKREVCMCSVWV